MSIKPAAETLLTALRGVAGVRVYDDSGANVDPDAVVLGPPTLEWAGVCPGPTSARWTVYVVVKASDRALQRLWDLVPAVADAVDAVPDAAVIRADPGVFSAGGVDLPCYQIQVDVSLGD